MATENPTNTSRAEELKVLANEAFKAHKYSQAIDLYTQAIEANEDNAVYWANRAFAHTKLEERGAAYLAMGKFKDALKDFQQVKKLCPNDPDASKKLKECEKAVMKLKFEEAISVPESEKRSVADSIDYRTIDVEPQYSGARIEGDVVTLDFVKKMMDDFKNQKCLHKRYAYQIVLQIRDLLRELPSLVDINVPDGKHFTVCGDVHGQVLPWIPACTVGSDIFFVVHGGLFSVDGVKLSDIKAIDRFCEPPEEGSSLARSVNCYAVFYISFSSQFSSRIIGLMCELLWSDPQPQLGRGPSKRGVGLSFGADVTKRFLQDNNLDLVVRSHEVKDEGYEIEHDGKLITVFSAPNYCDQMGNKGAFIRFEAPEMKPNIVTFSAVPHPDVKPMAYANNFLRMFS
ncbi:hypothetical protein DH2020_031825 [Rehmannia glutinosa]|uniref:protein-serine/threonine phosphatase n=1 Tax=Rehmannia glutinosa TaxID=99300 RepID=A0ABR0VK77_REHGL